MDPIDFVALYRQGDRAPHAIDRASGRSTAVLIGSLFREARGFSPAGPFVVYRRHLARFGWRGGGDGARSQPRIAADGMGRWQDGRNGHGKGCCQGAGWTCWTRPGRYRNPDIAHGLALSRAGTARRGDWAYSVAAEHSLLVEEIFAPESMAPIRIGGWRPCCIDAPEYVIGDMISPVKAASAGEYGEMDDRGWRR